MDIYRINGNRVLNGTVAISGAKNAALPVIVASILAKGKTKLSCVPDLMDIRTTIKVIEYLGAETAFNPDTNELTVSVNEIRNAELPYDLVKTMRASIYVMGPLLALCGEADVSLPGGCAIGERPVDIHLAGFEALGATIDIEHGYIKARAKKLKGAKYTMPKVSVGATINILMAASLAEGTTILENCAMEPDVVDVGLYLIQMGAKIEGLGTERIIIHGVSSLRPADYRVMPDRIEAGTYLIAGAATRGDVTVTGIVPEHIDSTIKTLAEMGFSVETGTDSCRIRPGAALSGALIQTMPHPGFPTDLQAPMMALMTTLPGISVMVETIFENRFTHVPELRRMGAKVTIEGRSAIVQGVSGLSAAPVQMSDLRAGAALIVAGLMAQGETEIRRIYHSDRGYEKLCHKLTALGADIRREQGGI